ncbi:hypothetical protein AC481_02375 [miscellaneous Crenarchaeota group archaeon SMTZ-80]|nr:MAG: hypothetical protein AC481_02375 [miscellaneous Crenarchaeota group archaeon SMTZ-80]
MSISAIIPTLNSERTIAKCLESFSKQVFQPKEIIVIDGESTDSTIEIVENFDNVTIMKEAGSPGFARNLGAKIAIGEIIFFCDSDCNLDQKALKYHTRVYENSEYISGVMGSIRRAGISTTVSNFFQKQIMFSDWLLNLNEDGTLASHLRSTNFSIKKNIFDQYKFREDLVRAEDDELFIRFKKNGIKILYEPRAIIYHYHPTNIEELFNKYMGYGEGFFQVDRIHGKDFRERYQFFSPTRYITFSKKYLKDAVLSDNRLLCKDCKVDKYQHCKIESPEIIKNITESNMSLHRITCLAIASGILKQRKGIYYKLHG